MSPAHRTAVGLSLLTLTAGCHSVPHGGSGGRIGTYDTTAADIYDGAASTVTLVEFADQVKEELPARIVGIDEIAGRETKAVIYLGDIVNNTRTPTNDFVVTRQIVNNGLINSPLLNEHAKVYVDPQRVERLRKSFTGQSPAGNVIDGLPTSNGAPLFAPEDVFVLDGEMGEITRGGGGVSLYVFDFRLIQATDGRVLFNSQLVSKEAR